MNEWLTAINLSIVSALVFMGVNVVSPILPQFALTFNIPIALTGWAVSSYALARVLADVPGGMFGSRYGSKKIMISGLAITAISSIVAGLAPTYLLLVSARFSAGIGSAFYVVGAMSLLARLSQRGERGKMMGLYSSTVFIGMSAGPAIGGFIAACYGIQAPFYTYAFLTVLGIVFTIPLREPESKSSMRIEGLRLRDLKTILSNQQFILVSLAVLALFFLRSSVRSTLIPLYASINLGLGADQIGLLMTIGMITTAFSSFPSGWLSDRVGRKRPTMICLFSLSFLILLVPFQISFQSLTILIAVYGLATGFQSAVSAWPADIAPANKIDAAMGIYRFIADLGFFLGPITATYVSDIFNPELITAQSFIIPSLVATMAGIGLIKAKDSPKEQLTKTSGDHTGDSAALVID